jgi:glucose-6-phosphate dehydrogenase assembly protein OpcA
MAAPVSAVVERAWRASTPDTVEDDLAALWREMAAAGPTLARAVMANLVVFRFHERRTRETDPAPDIDAALEAIIGLHPSRAIVIEHDRGEHAAQAPSSAGVGISVFGPTSARYGVERIVVRSACAEVSLPSIVRRFIRGDRPTSLWWTEDLSRGAPADVLIDLARQLLYDSRHWRDVQAGFQAIAPLAAQQRVDLADLNWRRLDPMRRALVHAVGAVRADRTTLRLSIAHRPGDAALGWLLAGWLASRLKLARNEWPSVQESRFANEFLTLTIEDGATTVTAALNGDRVHVSQHGVSPLTVPAPREHEAEAMAAELRTLSRDRPLAEAIAALAAREFRL